MPMRFGFGTMASTPDSALICMAGADAVGVAAEAASQTGGAAADQGAQV